MDEFVTVRSMLSLFLQVFLIMLQPKWSQGQMVPAMFVMGDSLVDNGNNNHLPASLVKAKFPHNGIDFPGHIATGRFSNGRNSADLLAKALGLPSPPPYLSTYLRPTTLYLGGVNFASGGSLILDSLDILNTQSISLRQQVKYYLKVHEDLSNLLGTTAQENLAKSLFFILIGGNDILRYFRLPDIGKPTFRDYVGQMITVLKSQIKILYSNGARKFLVAGLPPVGCCPSQRITNDTRGCREDSNTLTIMFNTALEAMLQSLKTELTDMRYSYGLTYPLVYGAITDPASYGFKEVKAACCGLGDLNAVIPCLPTSTYCSNRSDYLFWDRFHPTEMANQLFVDSVFSGPPQYTTPINVQQLVAS